MRRMWKTVWSEARSEQDKADEKLACPKLYISGSTYALCQHYKSQ